jgi:hypothetical protein
MADERFATPVSGNERKQGMLALVPLARTRWQMAPGDGNAPWLLRMTMMTRWPEEAEGTSAFGSIQQ